MNKPSAKQNFQQMLGTFEHKSTKKIDFEKYLPYKMRRIIPDLSGTHIEILSNLIRLIAKKEICLYHFWAQFFFLL